MTPENTAPATPIADTTGAGQVLVAKVKQVKTKVTERVRKDKQGVVISVCWDVHVGSALVRVYSTPSKDRELYTVSYWVDRKRKREVFPSLEKALAVAKATGKQLTKGDLGSADLSAAQRVACARALQLLAPTAAPIEIAAGEYAAAITKLRGRASLAAVVDYFLKKNPADIPTRLVSEVMEEMLNAKAGDGLSEAYLRHLRYDLEKFAAAFKTSIGTIAGTDVDRWLRGLGVSPRTRNNLRNAVQTLFRYAKARKYLPKDHDELEAVSRAKDRDGEIEVFTPAEMTEILAHAAAPLIPFLTLAAFAGIRHAEIQRLDWRDIEFEAGLVEVRAKKAKTASRRTVPLLDNLAAWLAGHRRADGPVCFYRNVASEIEKLVRRINIARRAAWATQSGATAEDLKRVEAKARGRLTKQKMHGAKRLHRGPVAPGAATAEHEGWAAFSWKHNALRHSFISYRVADIQNVAQVALEAGNSPQMIFKHYRELVRPAEAKRWFGLKPGGAQNVIPMWKLESRAQLGAVTEQEQQAAGTTGAAERRASDAGR